MQRANDEEIASVVEVVGRVRDPQRLWELHVWPALLDLYQQQSMQHVVR